MTNEQEEQLIIILSDFIPIMDGDRVQGVSPNAKDLTRQKVLEQLEEEQSQLPEGDPALLEWEEENIELLKMITDEEFLSTDSAQRNRTYFCPHLLRIVQ